MAFKATGFGFGLLMFLLVSCGRQEALSPSEYVTFWHSSDSPFLKAKHNSVYDLKCRLMSPEIMALRDMGVEAQERSLDTLIRYYSQSTYFEIEFMFHNDVQRTLQRVSGSWEDYNEGLQDILYNTHQSFILVNNGDTLEPSLYHCDRAYEMKKSLKVHVAFPSPYRSGNTKLLMARDHIFGLGTSRFLFDLSEINAPGIANSSNS